MVTIPFGIRHSNHMQKARAGNAFIAASQQLLGGWWKWQGRRQPIPCSHSARLMSSFISPQLVFWLFAPLLLWKWMASVKWRICVLKNKKKPSFTRPQRHIYFILKGRFEVTLQYFPSDIFRFDILWHFQLNIADIPAEELKACLKGRPTLKLFLSLSIFLPLSRSVSLSQTFSFPPLDAATHSYSTTF